MFQVPIKPIPNQSIAFNVDGAYWQIHLFQSVKSMCMDILRNGVAVALGVRCYVGMPIMQYEYMYMPNFGNFIFDAEVDWNSFGSICNLYYLQLDELQQFKDLIAKGSV